MQILENISLKPYNTFGIDSVARYFTQVSDNSQLKEVLEWAKPRELQTLVVGGGSNILFTKDFDGLVIHNMIKGIEKINEDDDYVYIKTGAGELWHAFVLYCLQHNYAGVENLALIPGFTGASPMQNIGAYGAEIKDVFHELSAFHKFDMNDATFNSAACEFGYRESVFKNRYKDQFVITSVTYRLQKVPHYNIEYGAIRKELEKNQVKDLSIQAIAQAVINIRTAKLPDPKLIGNAGSFFKNPTVTKEQYQKLKSRFEKIVGYENEDGSFKLAAGWMIEQCGLKGHRKGDAAVHDKQALVLVNHGHATGEQVLQLCHTVKEAIMEKFGVVLMPEVNII